MTPDLLITRYIDGDLTPDEDDLLRRMIADDPDVKGAFEASVLLHIAMSCEDRTPVPADLTADTLARIDAIAEDEDRRAIAAMPPAEPEPPVRSSGIRGRSMALLAMILFMAVPVVETVQHLTLVPSVDAAAIAPPELPTPRASGIRQNAPRRTASMLTQAASTNGTMGTSADAADAQNPAAVAHHTPPADAALATVTADRGPHADVRQNDEPTVSMPSVPALPSPTVTAMVFGTYAGTALGGTNSAISNASVMSQSIGYVVGDGTIFGLEIGALQFDERSETAMQVRTPGGRTSVRGGGALSKLENEPTVPETPTTVRNSMITSSTRIWGSVFAQHRILRTSFADIDVRGGVGADEAGFTGYGRVTGRTQLQTWLSASVGGEVRTFGGVGYGMIFSAIVGIQINP